MSPIAWTWADLDESARRSLVVHVLTKHKGNVTKAAAEIRIHRTQLSQFISKNAALLGLVCVHCGSRLKIPSPAPPVPPAAAGAA